jgi:hypothetical protein
VTATSQKTRPKRSRSEIRSHVATPLADESGVKPPATALHGWGLRTRCQKAAEMPGALITISAFECAPLAGSSRKTQRTLSLLPRRTCMPDLHAQGRDGPLQEICFLGQRSGRRIHYARRTSHSEGDGYLPDRLPQPAPVFLIWLTVILWRRDATHK